VGQRQVYCFLARGTSGRLNAQLPLQIASSSAREQAVSRELFAAFDLGHGPRGGVIIPTSNEPITTDSVEPIIRHRLFLRLTSFGGEGRAVDR